MVGNEGGGATETAGRNDRKGCYSGLKEVCDPQAKQPVHLKSSDGMETFTHRKSVMAVRNQLWMRWLNR